LLQVPLSAFGDLSEANDGHPVNESGVTARTPALTAFRGTDSIC